MKKSLRIFAMLAIAAAAAVAIFSDDDEKEHITDAPEEEKLPDAEEEEEKPETEEKEEADNRFIGDWVWKMTMVDDEVSDAAKTFGEVVTHINEDGTVYNNDVKIGLWQMRENDLVIVADPDEEETIKTVDGVHIALCGFDEDDNLIMVVTMNEEDQVGKIMAVRAE